MKVFSLLKSHQFAYQKTHFTIPEPPRLMSNPALKQGTVGNTEYYVRVKHAVVMHEYTN